MAGYSEQHMDQGLANLLTITSYVRGNVKDNYFYSIFHLD